MEEKHKQETDFLKETIKQRPLNRRKLLRRTIITAAMAVIFGTVACLTFLLLEPVISNRLYPEEEPSTVVFVEETEENEKLPEDMIADDSQMIPEPTPEPTPVPAPEPDPAELEEKLGQLLAETKLGINHYESLYGALAGVAGEVQKSMVTVAGVTSDVDWFDNAYENRGMVSGVIVADNGRELLILANINSIKGAESVTITFADNMEYAASVKKKDGNTGLAVVSVLKTDMKMSTAQMAKPVTLGTSAVGNLSGQPVIALGQPMGAAGSVCYGFITSSGNAIDLPDSRYKWMATDIYGSTSATGVLTDLKGQVIGIIDMSYSGSDTKNLIGAVGITELKKVIQRLSNDENIPYMGVHGADVTMEANEELGVPFGAYIMEIDMDSPAMDAGIQSGDVIVSVDGNEIMTYQELVSAIVAGEPEQNLSIGLLRQGPEGYAEMNLNVVLSMK